MSTVTLMEKEAAESPSVIKKQLQENQELCLSLSKRLHNIDVPFVLTVARGSSDHAANFAKYIFETQLNLATALAAPSVTSIYHSKLKLKNALVIGLSQSGQSPDVCEVMQMARQQGAITLALVNQTESPLAKIAEFVLPLQAGKEAAVAATKSFIATLAAILHFVAIYKQDNALLAALEELPECLEQALESNWSEAMAVLQDVDSCLSIGRGYGYPIAQEAALKFKETCSINAGAFSGAEVMHGPLALVKPHYPIMLFAQQDAALSGLLELTEKLTELGAQTLLALPQGVALPKKCGHILNFPASSHAIVEPIIAIQAAYPMIARLATARGFDPDQPKNLRKVTKTL
ncbi:MAG: iron dicitrate transport regulator FecR [Gammaproteobacteria bacterium]|jgi:glucosamine--fructose-6-phosphate aminotransferase (isomerizing)|nr:iron dicitrate transport regulator FecR [Gammaproteobacteria bacterium]